MVVAHKRLLRLLPRRLLAAAVEAAVVVVEPRLLLAVVAAAVLLQLRPLLEVTVVAARLATMTHCRFCASVFSAVMFFLFSPAAACGA